MKKINLVLIKIWHTLKDGAIYTGKSTIKAFKKTAFFIGKVVRETFKALFKGLGLILDDLLLIAGIVCVIRGVFMIYIPAGYIVLGLCLFGLACLVAYRR